MAALPCRARIKDEVAFRSSRRGPDRLKPNIKSCTHSLGRRQSHKNTAKFSCQKRSSAVCKALAILGAQHFHFTILRDPFMFFYPIVNTVYWDTYIFLWLRSISVTARSALALDGWSQGQMAAGHLRIRKATRFMVLFLAICLHLVCLVSFFPLVLNKSSKCCGAEYFQIKRGFLRFKTNYVTCGYHHVLA